MKKILLVSLVVSVAIGLALTGCGPQKAESSQAAIEQAKTMETTQQKVNYLVSQGKAFINSDEFQNAVDVAQYILRYLDADSTAAKGLLQTAKDEMAAQLKSAAEEAKKGFAGFGE